MAGMKTAAPPAHVMTRKQARDDSDLDATIDAIDEPADEQGGSVSEGLLTGDEIDMAKVWAEYGRTHAREIRNFLIEKFHPLVRFKAERIYARLPDEVDVQDLVSAGTFGLMDAIEAFDPSRGVKFETYCAPRIQGAILDELRSMDWVPRLVRSRTAKVYTAKQRFQMAHGRAPTREELADALGLAGEDLDKVIRDGAPVSTYSINRKCFNTDGSRETQELDIIRDEQTSNPFAEIQRRDVKNLITRGLSRAERLILILYYYEEMTMKEIGATLDLSESRVSQMHSSILDRLKAQMQHRSREFEPAE